MKNENIFALLALGAVIVIALACLWGRSTSLLHEQAALVGAETLATTSPPKLVIPKTTYAVLAVPYMSEAPSGIWTGPWKNACEEVSIFMVDRFYKGESTSTISDAETYMKTLFSEEDAKFGSDVNADSSRMAYLIDTDADFSEKIVNNPSVMDIKNQIAAGHPVITLHAGFNLHNSHIPFLAVGSAYHVMVVVGFDDKTREFIVNDPGDTVDGALHRYGYDTFMKSLHDYDFKDNKADGAPTVIFTSPK